MGDVDLREFDEVYDAVEPPARGEYEELPDGVYQVRVDKVELKHSKVRDDGGGNPMLVWELRVISPLHEGAKLTRRNMILTEDNLAFLKGDLLVCGLELQRLSHLPGRLHELLDLELEVKKVTKGQYTNIYVNKRLRAAEVATEESEGGEDDLPF